MSSPALEILSPSKLGPSKPFPGLRPYEEQDSAWFFGRGQEINDLLKRLRRTRFIAVVGPSGCGKSSLVRAGLIAAVRDDYMDVKWLVATFRPGEAPVRNLANVFAAEPESPGVEAAIELLKSGPMGLVKAAQSRQGSLHADCHFLIVIDQFEELFQFVRRGGDDARDEAKAFLKLLLTAAASSEVPIYIVTTMRLEWLYECCTYTGLAEAMNEGLYLVPQMTRRQFQQSVLGPIEAARGTITGALLDRMLNDLDGRSDQLPVLGHALMRMWDLRKPEQTLDIPAYLAVGTFDNCLSNQAEKEVFEPLGQEEKKAAELLFRSITQVSQNRKTRRPRSIGEILAERQVPLDRVKRVVEEFRKEGRSFLVATLGPLTQESIVDLSHEALIRQWDRLSTWVDQEAELEARTQRLEEVAAEWQQGGQEEKSLLYSGNTLNRTNDLKSRFKPGGPAKAFLLASRQAEFRRQLTRRGSLAGIAIVLIGGAAGWGLYFVHDAQTKQRDAQTVAARQSNYEQQYKQWFANQIKKIAPDDSPAGSKQALSALVSELKAKRVYLQYASESQVPLIKPLQTAIASAGYSAPGAELVGNKAPAHTQVRYFREEDRTDADKIADVVRSLVNDSVATNQLGNPNNLVPAGQYEVWLSASAQKSNSFAVIGSYATLKAAQSAVDNLSSKLPGLTYKPEVYLTENGRYALTLGGYLNPSEANRRVQAAQKGIPDAYSKVSNGWGENLLR